MIREQFENRIQPLLRMFPNTCQDDAESWRESFSKYPVEDIENAIRTYANRNGDKSPVNSPYDILTCIPLPRPVEKYVPRFETIRTKTGNMATIELIYCKRCRNKGLITWSDKEQRDCGKPCECIIGKERYGDE